MSIQQTITQKVQQAFQPDFLQVDNESHMHSVPANSETHFKVTVVTPIFAGVRAVQRHQKLYQLLSHELQNGVHALALHTYTPEEWAAQTRIPESPQCMGGE